MLAAFPRPAAGASSMSPTAAFIPARPTRVADEAAAVESETRKLAAELAPPVRSVTIPVRGLLLILSAAVVVAVLLSLEIGRESCRERGCAEVKKSGGCVDMKQKNR